MKTQATPSNFLAKLEVLQAQLSSLEASLTDSELKRELAEIKLEQAQERNRWWEEQYKLAKARRFGKASEKSSQQQLSLFDEIEAPLEEFEAEEETITYTRKKKSTGRKVDTSKLPRETVVHELSETDQHCDSCNVARHEMGRDVVEKLVYIPEVLKVIEHVYPKMVCRCCESIKMPKREEGPIQKSIATSSLITEVIISKYERHIPLYRRSQMFKREGIEIPDNTLGNWMMQASEALYPLQEALWQSLYDCHYLQVDETPVKVLKENRKGYMWCYHHPEPDKPFVIFDYHLSRSGEIPTSRLSDYQGIVQTDGYSGYSSLRKRDDIINIGCFAHCRRKFIEAGKVAGKQTMGLSRTAVNFIGKLYRLETKIKTLAPDKKHQQRQLIAKPILEEFHQWLMDKKSTILQKSLLGTAITYALNQWTQLSAYAEHGVVNIDNNWCENQIRPFALGRKNWLFIGNERGGHAAALLYSLIQTCKLNNINARQYFIYVLDQTHQMRRGDISAFSLLPQNIDPNLLT